MEIEFIKWMVEYAEKFSWDEETVTYKEGSWLLGRLHDAIKTWGMYPLILQRAIEGINLSTQYTIEIKIVNDEGGSVGIGIMVNGQWVKHYYLDYDQAKEAGLKYIYEQENKPLT
jgi:hypothetical protein